MGTKLVFSTLALLEQGCLFGSLLLIEHEESEPKGGLHKLVPSIAAERRLSPLPMGLASN